MPKETGRTQKIRAALLELQTEKTDWTERALRQACYGKLAENDADEKETQRLKDSIRRIVSQMQASGELTTAKRIATRKTGDEKEKGREETADAATPSDALPESSEKERESVKNGLIPSAPGSDTTDTAVKEAKTPAADAPGTAPAEAKREEARPTVKMPKAKQMNDFLADALQEDAAKKEETLVGAAVAFFGVSGEQVNGVRGLVIQCLMEQKKSGTVLYDKTEGYRKAKAGETTAEGNATPASPEKTPAQPPKQEGSAQEKPAPLPQVAVKRIGKGTRSARKAETEPKRGLSRLVMNENRFAERINAAGGGFFTEFVARLFEGYFRSHGLTVCGRYVVDGSDDKGVDVILQTVDELGLGNVVLLQAKTRSSGQVTLKELREFYGVMAAEKADRGLFVTTSTFTTDAVTFVRSHPDLAAVDKYKLFALASRLGIGLVSGENGELSVDPELFG